MSREGKIGKRTKPKKRKTNISLVFDAKKRHEYLTGFQKRNQEKRKQAQEKLEQKLNEERKRIHQEAKESYKKLVVTNRPIPELEKLFSHEIETEESTVKIVELSTDELYRKNNWIGQNRPHYSEDEKSSESEETDTEELPGMEPVAKKVKKCDNDEDTKKASEKKCMSGKDVKKIVKRQATENVKKSKVFQKKNKQEQIKSKKKSQRLKFKRMKTSNVPEKKKHIMKRNKSNNSKKKNKPNL